MTKPDEADAAPDVRRKPRYVVSTPVMGRFSGFPVRVVDISAGGLQMEHSSPLRIGATGTVAIDFDETIEFTAKVTWSRYNAPGAQGEFLYRSGAQLQGDLERIAGKLGRFVRAHGRPAVASFAQKGRSRSKVVPPASGMTFLQPQDDDGTLIRRARRELASSPDEALRWYNRARYALAAGVIAVSDLSSTRYRDEVLAVWEFLGRRYPVGAIVQALEGKQEG